MFREELDRFPQDEDLAVAMFREDGALNRFWKTKIWLWRYFAKMMFRGDGISRRKYFAKMEFREDNKPNCFWKTKTCNSS